MPKYDFHNQMEPHEFQRFAVDIIDTREKTHFEVFSEGKDLGIDAYKKTKNGITTIVQAKRTENFKDLLKVLKNSELAKIKKLNPDRYILITSSTISKTQKPKIIELLSPYIKNSDDIISKEDLNKYLTKEKYKKIELNYPSLWFNSANTFLKEMSDVVNHSIYEESLDELEKVKQSMKNYVIPENFSTIISNLENDRVILIAGNPGIGKTSLGRAIVSYYIIKDYELIYTKEIDKANQVYKRDGKQIFFLDDYWGSSFKDKNYSHIENTKFINFVDKISKTNNKILVITSRDYIIKQVDNDLKRILGNKEYLLDIKKISLNLRYKILYKYLSTSNINYSYIEYILENPEMIIKHNNFNPRIIEMYINSDFHLEVTKYKYLEYLIETLDSPISFLDEVYQKQTKEAQLLLYLMLTIEPPILLEDLEEVYLNILNSSNKNYNNYNLENIISQLEKNFIRTYYINNKGIVIDFINNSIIDYLYDCKDNFKEFEFDIINNLTYFNQMIFFLKDEDNFWKLPLLPNSYKTIKDKLISDIDNLSIIIGTFYDTIEYYNMTSEEQLIYKLLKLCNIDDLDKEVIELIIEKYNQIINALDNKDRTYIYEDNLSELLRIYEKIMVKELKINKSIPIDFNKYLKKLLPEEEIQDLKKYINKNKYLKNFKDTKESTDILIQFYKTYHSFPNTEEDFYKILITAPTITMNIKSSQYIMITLAYLLFINNKPIFKKDDILEILSYSKINKKEVFKLLDTSLFRREEEWYCFATKELQAFCLSLYISYLYEKDKEEFYNRLISILMLPSEVDFEYLEDLNLFYEYFQKNDKDSFNKYFIYEILENYLSKTNSEKEHQTITSIIEFFHFELILEELSYDCLNSYSYINAETADILELVTGEYADLEELVSEKAFKEFINSFKEKVKFKYGKYRINLTELTKNEKFFNWLKKYKIDNKIMSIHNKIVKEMNNIEKEFYIIQ